MKKPMWNGKHPTLVTRAKAIDLKINKKISLCHIDDANVDNDDIDDPSDHEPPPLMPTKSTLLWPLVDNLMPLNLAALELIIQLNLWARLLQLLILRPNVLTMKNMPIDHFSRHSSLPLPISYKTPSISTNPSKPSLISSVTGFTRWNVYMIALIWNSILNDA
jgi:hypothetical protein